MKIDDSTDHFEDATKFLSREAKWHVLDALACMFHNEGYSLDGNTEASDVVWFARILAEHLDHRRLDSLPEVRQEELQKIAKVAIESLPAIANRIAHRFIQVSKALRTSERIAREQTQQLAEKKRRGRY